MSNLPNIKDMTLVECEAFIADLGSPRYRARQIMRWIYRYGVESFAEMTNLSKTFREQLALRARISKMEMSDRQVSAIDDTKKVLFQLEDGLFIESVLIPGTNHWSICISTQVGCRMGCAFCMTGKTGFKRNLHPSEIVDQINMLRRKMPAGEEIKNIVAMGMGEPLDNYDNLLKAIAIIASDYGVGISARRMTVSTCGIVPKIVQLGKEFPVNLAVSLNAPNNKTRSELMPINNTYPLEKLLSVCNSYPMPKRRRVTFEYIMIDGVNDSVKAAKELASQLKGVKCKLNLIVWNSFPDAKFKSPSREKAEAFQNELTKYHYTAIIRASKGSDILAACGQLSGNKYFGNNPILK